MSVYADGLMRKAHRQMKANSYFYENRKEQEVFWLHHIIKQELGNKKYEYLKTNNKIIDLEKSLKKGISINEIINNI